MFNKQPVQLSPGLQALMVLKQQANPTAPNGQATVAGQEIQKAQQGIAGMMAMRPTQQPQGIMDVVDNAQQAMPSVQQNAQNAQAEGIAQRAAQLMQPKQPGVTGLPANNMGFAEGGIIGYDGEGESYVETPDEARARKQAEMLAIQAKVFPGVTSRADMYKRTPLREASVPEATPQKPLWLIDEEIKSKGVESLLAAMPNLDVFKENAPTNAPAAQKAPGSGSAKVNASVRVPGAVPASSNFVDENYNKYLAPGIARMEKNADEQRGLAAEGKKIRGAAAPVGKTALDTLAQTRQELQALHERANSESAMNGLRAWLQGAARGSLGGAGAASGAYNASEMGRQKEFINTKLLLGEKQSALEDAQRAQKEGDHDKYVAAINQVHAIDEKIAKSRSDYAQHATSAMGGVESAKIHAAAQLQVARVQAAAHAGALENKDMQAFAQYLKAVEADPALKGMATLAATNPNYAAKYNARMDELAKPLKVLNPKLYEVMTEGGGRGKTGSTDGWGTVAKGK